MTNREVQEALDTLYPNRPATVAIEVGPRTSDEAPILMLDALAPVEIVVPPHADWLDHQLKTLLWSTPLRPSFWQERSRGSS